MPRSITCQECRKHYVIRDRYAGSPARCSCGCVQLVSASAPGVPAPGGFLDSPILLLGSLGLLLMSLLAGGGTVAWVSMDRQSGNADSHASIEKTDPEKKPLKQEQEKKEEKKEVKKEEKKEVKKEEKKEVKKEEKKEEKDPIKQIEDVDPKISRKGVEALSRVDPAEAQRAVPALSRALQRHADEEFRRRITEGLERIGPPAKADLDCLAPLAKLRYKPAQLYAIEALRQLGADARPGIPILVQALKDRDSEVRKKAAMVLRDMGPTARPLAFQALLTSASDKDEEVSKAAFDALSELGKLTPAEIELLTEAVGDDKRNVFVRRFAALRLGELGSQAGKSVPTLTQVLKDEKDDGLLKLSADAPGQIGEKPKETLAALLQLALSEAAETVRLASLDALARLDLAGFTTSRMLERISPDAEPNAKVRMKIAQLLDVRVAALKNEDLGELKPFLGHKDSEVVLIGLNVIARKKAGAGLIPDVVALMKHKDEKVSEKALKVLEALGPEAKSGLPALTAAIKDVAEERRLNLAMLMISIDAKDSTVQDAVLPIFIEELHPKRIQVGERSQRPAIHKALVKIGQPAVDAIFKTFAAVSYKGRENGTYRLNLFMALEGLGPSCKSMENWNRLRPLRAREAKEWKDTHAAAAKALGAMDPR